MDDDLAGGSTAATGGPPAAQPAADWNTSLAVPAAEFSPAAPASDARGDSRVGGASDTAGSGQLPGKPRPEWRDPADLPTVQRALEGGFGDQLRVLNNAVHTLQTVMAAIEVEGLSDPEVIALTQVVEQAGRPVDAARVRTATAVGFRARRALGRESLAWRLGASHANDLLTRLTGTSSAEMKRRVLLGEKVAPRAVGGVVLEAEFPLVAAALTAGELGIDAAETIVKGLADYTAQGRLYADPAAVDRAEADLVERATGSIFGRTPGPADPADPAAATGPVGRLGDSAGFTYPANEITKMTARWQAVLNPDGAAPNDPVLEAKSTFSFGTKRNGLYPLRGGVTPELKGTIEALFNTFQSARSAPKFPSAGEQQRIEAGELVPGEILDERTGGEKRADILRGILTQVAQDPRTPTMGGMPPTVMVHVNATDLLADVGVGWIDGIDGPVSMTTVNQMIDNGGMQPVYLATNGAVLALGRKTRFFNRAQRRAITARDGGCIIAGCTSPAQWAEVHHVVPWYKGGPTNVDNGVLLCWYHHHTIETSGWEIRMVTGVPQVKAPAWIDPTGKWRTPDPHRAHDPRTRKPPHTE
ncbi:DUF222 domain-containing protein [Cryobacterium sp. AP23]